MKRFIIVMVLAIECVLIAMFIPSAANAGWKANTFVSPTRNIRCHYFGNGITCMTANNRRQVVLNLYGGSAYEVYNLPDVIATPFTHVLYYGQTYVAWHLQCLSTYNYMACRSSHGHGFQINRAGIDTW